MMNINEIDMGLTIFSIIVTIISILCSFVSFHYAKNARQYKEATAGYLRTMDCKQLLGKFDAVCNSFFSQTRKDNWYKGIDPNVIIAPMSSILQSFSEIYPQIAFPDILKTKVHQLDLSVQVYDKATLSDKKLARNIAMEILDFLNQAIADKSNQILYS